MEIEQSVNAAVESFKKLLLEQLDRTEVMERAAAAKDYSALKTLRVGLLGGDGIGPVIMEQAERVLRLLLEYELKTGRAELVRIEGMTIEDRLACGESVPALAAVKSCDVLLKGPTTTPKGGSMESANVTLRRELDLYANVRPVSVPEQGIDWVFFRENTEGEYVLGSRGIEIPGKLCMDFKVTTEPGTRRIARAAFEYAKANGKTSVSIVTKANIMKKTDGRFSEICHEIAAEYPGIEAEDYYIDIMTANLVNDAVRSRFQVFLLPNLYGDIITDEAAQIQGGVGTAGAANIGGEYAMFEAIHGSAPRMVEQGRGAYANPASIIKAAELLLRHVGMTDKADRLAAALHICCETEKRLVVKSDGSGATCAQFGDYVLETLRRI